MVKMAKNFGKIEFYWPESSYFTDQIIKSLKRLRFSNEQAKSILTIWFNHKTLFLCHNFELNYEIWWNLIFQIWSANYRILRKNGSSNDFNFFKNWKPSCCRFKKRTFQTCWFFWVLDLVQARGGPSWGLIKTLVLRF